MKIKKIEKKKKERKKKKKKNVFQAEDGIRDRSPSRGLGNVYKRKALSLTFFFALK